MKIYQKFHVLFSFHFTTTLFTKNQQKIQKGNNCTLQTKHHEIFWKIPTPLLFGFYLDLILRVHIILLNYLKKNYCHGNYDTIFKSTHTG